MPTEATFEPRLSMALALYLSLFLSSIGVCVCVCVLFDCLSGARGFALLFIGGSGRQMDNNANKSTSNDARDRQLFALSRQQPEPEHEPKPELELERSETQTEYEVGGSRPIQPKPIMKNYKTKRQR